MCIDVVFSVWGWKVRSLLPDSFDSEPLAASSTPRLGISLRILLNYCLSSTAATFKFGHALVRFSPGVWRVLLKSRHCSACFFFFFFSLFFFSFLLLSFFFFSSSSISSSSSLFLWSLPWSGWLFIAVVSALFQTHRCFLNIRAAALASSKPSAQTFMSPYPAKGSGWRALIESNKKKKVSCMAPLQGAFFFFFLLLSTSRAQVAHVDFWSLVVHKSCEYLTSGLFLNSKANS